MKRFFKILFINISIILFILVVAEVVSFYLLNKEDPNFRYQFIEQKFEDVYHRGEYQKYFRPTSFGRKEGVILTFGCCMTYGVFVDDADTLSAILSKYTGKTVINRGYPGWGLQHMYYQLNDPNFTDEVTLKPDYIVYTIIRDHYRRIYSNSSANEPYYLTYKIKNGKLVKSLNSILNRSLIVYIIRSIHCRNHFDKEIVDFYIIESYKKAKELYPNAKFIVLDMDGIAELYHDRARTENKKLNSYGIRLIDLTKYTDGKTIWELDHKYWCDDFAHPSAEYWEMVIPNIVKEFE